MKIVDLNVLLYAVNQDAVQHRRVHAWWRSALRGDETIGLPWVVLLGFLRLSTSAKVFPNPLTGEQACGKISAWLALPLIDIPTEKENHWAVMRRLLGAAGTAGNLTTDTHIATLALTRDATVISCDNDFLRYQGLRYWNPLSD